VRVNEKKYKGRRFFLGFFINLWDTKKKIKGKIRRGLEQGALALPGGLGLGSTSSIDIADLTHKAEESLIDICTCLGGCLKEGAAIALGGISALLYLDLALIDKIALVTAEDHGDVINILHTENLFAEGSDFVERATGSDSVDEEEALAGAHVLVTHSAVFLLTSSIEDIEEGGLTVDGDLLPVTVLDGRIVFIDEVILDELDSKSGLSDTTTTNNDNLVFGHLVNEVLKMKRLKNKQQRQKETI